MNAIARILHLNSMLTGGGTDDQCAKLVAGLHKLGQQVCVVGPDGRMFSSLLERGGADFYPASRGLTIAAARMIRREGIQVVHAHHGRDYWPAILAGHLSRRRPKIVLTRHMAKSPSSWASRHFLLKECDALVAVSKFAAQVLTAGAYEPNAVEAERRSRPPLRGDHSKIRVIAGGIDVERFRPFDASEQRGRWKLGPEHFAFAVVGGFDLPRGKGQREFLRAAARMHEQAPNARFLIIGRGSMEATLRADIEKLGLAKKAFLTGQCTEMPQAMNAIDCLVHPQIGTEAFGLVVCEAHACGKPVIASDLDGIPEAFAVANYGQLVPAEGIEALAQAMLFWSSRPRLDGLERLSLHRRVSAAFSVEAMARNYSELYSELVRGSHAPVGRNQAQSR